RPRFSMALHRGAIEKNNARDGTEKVAQTSGKPAQQVLMRFARFVAAFVFGLASLAATAASAPGTSIVNRATATANAGASGTMSSQSKVVTVTVAGITPPV